MDPQRASRDSTAMELRRPGQAIVLFDGVCKLCSGTVKFIQRRDPDDRFRFVPLQSQAARELLQRCGRSPEDEDSIVLVLDSRCLTKSDAVLGIARRLAAPWPALSALRIVPRPLRNWVYDFVARNRYGWFGRCEQCDLPPSDYQNPFLE